MAEWSKVPPGFKSRLRHVKKVASDLGLGSGFRAGTAVFSTSSTG